MSALGHELRRPWVPEVSEILGRGVRVVSNGRYEVFDLLLEGRTYSVTILKPHQETRGHSHDGVEEWYFFKEGTGRITIGDEISEIDCGRMSPSGLSFRVPSGAFHKVANTSDEVLTFVATFSGSRQETMAAYQGH